MSPCMLLLVWVLPVTLLLVWALPFILLLAWMLPFTLLLDVDDAIYLAVSVSADINTTYSRGTTARVLSFVRLWACTLPLTQVLEWMLSPDWVWLTQ